MTTHSTLDEYRNYIRDMAIKADGRVILNQDEAHATIVIAQIFASSSSIVKLLTGGLDMAVYGQADLVENACNFLKRSPTSKLEIAHEVDLEKHHPLMKRLMEEGVSDRLSVSRVSERDKSSYDYHFIVGDESNFRFQFIREKCNAMVKFGALDQGRQLSLTFDRLFSAKLDS